MTISFSRQLLIPFFLMLSAGMFGQGNFGTYAEPKVSVNLDPANRWSFNFGIANRNLIPTENSEAFEVQQLELGHFTSYEIGFYSKLSLGLLYRLRNARNDEKRLTVQFGSSRKYNLIKVAHRARLEQRWRPDDSYRSRYQFSVELPLAGERVDRKEYFLVTSTEALLSLGREQKPSFEQRLGLSIGRELSSGNKLSLGLEYQLDDYTQDTVHELFLLAGLTIAI